MRIVFAIIYIVLISCSSLNKETGRDGRLTQELICDLLQRTVESNTSLRDTIRIGLKSNLSPTNFLARYLNAHVENVIEGHHYNDLEFDRYSLSMKVIQCGFKTFKMEDWHSSMTSEDIIISDLFVYNDKYCVIFLEFNSSGHEYLYKILGNGQIEFIKESMVWID